MNLPELIEELRRVEETTLLELLNLSTDDLVDAFLDKIEEHQNKLYIYINDN